MIQGELNQEHVRQLQAALTRLELPPSKRRRLLWRMAKYGVEASSKRNVRNQISPDGDKWPARQTRRKGKMLRNMPKLIRIRELPETESIRLYLSGGHYHNAKGKLPAGVVGYVQQNGMNITVNRKQVAGFERGRNQPHCDRRSACVKPGTKSGVANAGENPDIRKYRKK